MGIRLRTPSGSALLPSHSFSTDTDLGLYRVSANVLGFSTGGTLRAQLSSAGWLNVDNVAVILGTGSDDTIVHDGTNTSWTHTTGNLIFDNQLVTGFTYMDVGTDTRLTGWGVRNNSGTALFLVLGSGVIVERSYKLVKQGAPTAKTVSATLTAAEILAGIITVNQAAGATSAQQLPTATDMDTGFPDAAAGDAFDFTVINTSTVDAEDASITTNTGWTLAGSMDIHAYSAAGSLNSSARFRARKTGAAAWTLYRMA